MACEQVEKKAEIANYGLKYGPRAAKDKYSYVGYSTICNWMRSMKDLSGPFKNWKGERIHDACEKATASLEMSFEDKLSVAECAHNFSIREAQQKFPEVSLIQIRHLLHCYKNKVGIFEENQQNPQIQENVIPMREIVQDEKFLKVNQDENEALLVSMEQYNDLKARYDELLMRYGKRCFQIEKIIESYDIEISEV